METEAIEIWKPITQFEGLYEISNHGRVRSLERICGIRRQNGSLLVGFVDKGGYYQVILRKDGKNFHKKRHILVAKAFIPNPENKPTVNHKFGDKSDNRAWMLEWATHSEQHKHAFAVLGRIHANQGNRNKVMKNSRSVAKYHLITGERLAVYSSITEAARLNGLHSPNVYSACIDITKKSGGFKWKFINE